MVLLEKPDEVTAALTGLLRRAARRAPGAHRLSAASGGRRSGPLGLSGVPALRPPRLDATADEVARTAAAAPDWATLAAAARACVACPELAAARQHVVVGDVPSPARPLVAFVGEAPGRDRGRDRAAVRRQVRRAARPAARRGRAATGRSAPSLNVVKCRPPGNRTPKAPEVARCSGWLHRQLELLDPPRRRGARAVRGEVVPRPADRARRSARGPAAPGATGAAVCATYHPSAAIRFGPNGAPRAALLADLRRVAAPWDAAVKPRARAARRRRTPRRSGARSPSCCAPATSSCWSGRWAPARRR